METDGGSQNVAEVVESKMMIYQILQSIQSPKTPDGVRKEAEA